MLRFLFPHYCLLCQQATSQHYALCEACEKELPWWYQGCYLCALPLPSPLNTDKRTALYCQRCLAIKAPKIVHTISTFRYEFPVSLMITQLKFGHALAYASLLGQLMIPGLKKYYTENPLPQAIMPVPLHVKRLRQRGFNQAVEIAKPLAKHFKVHLDISSVLRRIFTPQQSGLTATSRQQNIRKAFEINRPLSYEHVAIVDDVITTGATVNELAKTLHQGGVHTIEVWCCARTPRQL